MQRSEIIQVLEDQMVRNGSGRKDARSVLETYSDADLQKFYADRVKKEQPADPEGARANAQRKRLDAAVQHALDFEAVVMMKEKKRKAEAEAALPRDRETFSEATRRFRISPVQANFALIREVLGPGFTLYQLQEAIRSKSIHLAPVSQAELDEWAAQSIEERNTELFRIAEEDPAKLRRIVREEAEARRAQQHQQELEAADAARKARDIARGYPPLPPEISKDVIKQASTERLKDLIRKYGNDALTNRLRDLA